jgi:putative ABC transport system ATP-binding protein
MVNPAAQHALSMEGSIMLQTPAPLLAVRDLVKTYATSSGEFTALRQVSLDIGRGEFVAVVGKSGSGKSTLLNLITGIDSISAGEVWVDGEAVHAMSQSALSVWRGRRVGIVFQFFQLLPTLTVAENVMLPMDLCATFPRALQLLARLSIADQADKLPGTLSGGQQQRAAIARALANAPPILVADEPTGNLDSETTAGIMQLFASLAAEGTTVLMVTHERDFSPCFTRTVTMADGQVQA